MRYAGIGSRDLRDSELSFVRLMGAFMARESWELVTGAAIGCDQAFAIGALSVRGKVTLVLPWPNYESRWVNWARKAGAQVETVLPTDSEAWKSVNWHPNTDRLTKGVRALMARNYTIFMGHMNQRRVDLAIVFPKVNKWGNLGSTGQGLRICDKRSIKIRDLAFPDVTTAAAKAMLAQSK